MASSRPDTKAMEKALQDAADEEHPMVEMPANGGGEGEAMEQRKEEEGGDGSANEVTDKTGSVNKGSGDEGSVVVVDCFGSSEGSSSESGSGSESGTGPETEDDEIVFRPRRVEQAIPDSTGIVDAPGSAGDTEIITITISSDTEEEATDAVDRKRAAEGPPDSSVDSTWPKRAHVEDDDDDEEQEEMEQEEEEFCEEEEFHVSEDDDDDA